MWSRKPSTLDMSYLNLRLCIGVLGVALPFILRVGSSIFPPDPYSVSAYYYSAMRNILVASLCVLGTFLLTYQGYDKLDSRITNVCGAATIAVALFPTSNPGFKPTWVGHVHPVVAGIALAGQALMALQFTQSVPRDGTAHWLDDVKRLLRALVFRYAQRVHDEHGKKLTRNRIYSGCSWLIIIGVVLALAQNFWPDSVKAETQWLFWFESLSIASFGVAWLVKGETLLKDAAAPDQAVPIEAIPTQAVPVDATAADGAVPDAPFRSPESARVATDLVAQRPGSAAAELSDHFSAACAAGPIPGSPARFLQGAGRRSPGKSPTLPVSADRLLKPSHLPQCAPARRALPGRAVLPAAARPHPRPAAGLPGRCAGQPATDRRAGPAADPARRGGPPVRSRELE